MVQGLNSCQSKNNQTSSGVHSASYSMGTWVLCQR